MNQEIINQAIANAKTWQEADLSPEINEYIAKGLESLDKDFIESFYQEMAFGTGGMRGIMGVGSNRINIYTLGAATQALAQVILASNKNASVAIAFDSRNNSQFFAEKLADILSANGVRAYIFEAIRPTPQLSFAVREKGCDAGIVITASHNPPEYNGYKVYGSDGCQIVAPFDKTLIDRVRKTSFQEILWDRNEELVTYMGAQEDQEYYDAIKGLSLSQDLVAKFKEEAVVYTGLHGTGAIATKKAMQNWGFNNIIEVAEQGTPDGNFPTVKSPNPEEPEALEMAINLAKEKGVELVMGTDPDSDRVGIAVRDSEGKYILLNGNQTASLLFYYMLENTKFQGNEFIAKTVVTSDILDRIGEHYGIEVVNTLTGFKHIGTAIREREGSKKYIVGGEESYGYLIGDLVRDKDAISSCCMIAEAFVWAKSQGKSLLELLEEVHCKFGFYQESLNALTKKGIDGAQEIKILVENYRNNPMESIAGEKIVSVIDYGSATKKNLLTGEEEKVALPKSNFMQFITERDSKITVRPSGTEPKIKYYISVCEKDFSDYQSTQEKLNQKIQEIKKELGLA
ncbi:MAG: phospho-sugar mutase [Flavobacteriales bacterium]|jgi:phosphoglucomutase|nr:phospho-sugar mutase [Flavobacteriales bacterium]